MGKRSGGTLNAGQPPMSGTVFGSTGSFGGGSGIQNFMNQQGAKTLQGLNPTTGAGRKHPRPTAGPLPAVNPAKRLRGPTKMKGKGKQGAAVHVHVHMHTGKSRQPSTDNDADDTGGY